MRKRDLVGIIISVIGAGLILIGVFNLHLFSNFLSFLIWGVFLLVLGIVIFLNKKEDIIEEIKEVN